MELERCNAQGRVSDTRGHLAGSGELAIQRLQSMLRLENLLMSGRCWLLRLLVVGCLSLAQSPLSASTVSGSIPPFQAKGTLTTEKFTPGRGEAVWSIEAEAFFTYSNGLWEIELSFLSPSNYAGNSITCKRIPDGVRYIMLSSQPLPLTAKPGMITEAFALGIKYPPPEQTGLLPCWLSLCPDPELPRLHGDRMRRFLFADVQEHPQNQGSFSLRYLGDGGGFLAELNITNNGVEFPFKSAPRPYQLPFQHGFLELRYQVLETTNVGDLVFPFKTTLHRFSRLSGAKTAGDIYESSAETLRLSEILMTGSMPQQRALRPPERLLAEDERPAGLPQGITARYFVTNEEWVSRTNKWLVELASIYGRSSLPPRSRRHVALLIVFLTCAVVFPAVIVLARKIKMRRQKQMKL